MISTIVSRGIGISLLATSLNLIAFSNESTAYSQTVPFLSRSHFYEDSGLGAVAIMPHVTTEEGAEWAAEYIPLPKNSTYHISRTRIDTRDWWFVANHRSGSVDQVLGTYVGVLIAKRVNDDQKEQLQLYRNEDWRGSKDNKLGPFEDKYRGVEDFFRLQDDETEQDANTEQDALRKFEELFGKWHARPEKQRKDSSWDERFYWPIKHKVKKCFQSVGNRQFIASNIFFQARLLRFTPTTEVNPRNPVVWNIGTGGTTALFIMTFSPYGGNNFDSEYCMAIEGEEDSFN